MTAFFVAIFLPALAACNHDTDHHPSGQNEQIAVSAVLDDIKDLSKSVDPTRLPTAINAHWIQRPQGTHGDRLPPGPTDYFVMTVLEFDTSLKATLNHGYFSFIENYVPIYSRNS